MIEARRYGLFVHGAGVQTNSVGMRACAKPSVLYRYRGEASLSGADVQTSGRPDTEEKG